MRLTLTLILAILASSLYSQKISKQLTYADLELIDGTTITKSELENKVIVVNLWGTWCKPCVGEIPDLNAIQKEFEDKEDILFLAIADPSLDNPKKINAFLEKRNFDFQHLMPSKESIFFRLGGTVTFPTTLVYDKEGKLKKKINDSLTEKHIDQLTEVIEELSGE